MFEKQLTIKDDEIVNLQNLNILEKKMNELSKKYSSFFNNSNKLTVNEFLINYFRVSI